MDILAMLRAQQDEKYRAFQVRLIPGVSPDTVLGVRTPAIRTLAKTLRGTPDAAAFLAQLPHAYFDENQLHALLIAEIRDYAQAVQAVNRFLPFVDNWATCDQLRPRAFKKHRDLLIAEIRTWIASPHLYTARFGIGMLMVHYLDDAFSPDYPAMVAGVRSGEYYLDMMRAWYFATALAKQYDAVLPYLAENRLDVWTHNKTIQKASESFRVPDAQKAYLLTLRR